MRRVKICSAFLLADVRERFCPHRKKNMIHHTDNKPIMKGRLLLFQEEK